ncbi:MAG: hypothetical protein CVV17_03545, partial [Gammaproteobacteria bacterium HGW-Gammaproteobacteria-7]
HQQLRIIAPMLAGLVAIGVLLLLALISPLVRRLVSARQETADANTKLHDLEERWRFALDSTEAGVWDLDVPAGRILLSSRCKSMLGFDDSEIGDRLDAWHARIHPDDMPALLAARQPLLDGASDTFAYLVGIERDRVTASPRSLDRDITRTGAYTRVRITPDLRNTIDIGGAFNDQSDDNEGVHINGVWRRAMIRTPDLQLDAGLSGEWMHFSQDNDNGYYSPDNYRRIGGLVGAYVPLTSESGLSVQLGLGVQRDETFDDWERASDVSVEYTQGIFSDWQLKVRAGYVERVQSTGAFEGAAFGITLERRF